MASRSSWLVSSSDAVLPHPAIRAGFQEISEADKNSIREATQFSALQYLDILQYEENARSNTLGDFTILVTKRLNIGVYTITTTVKDGRGAQSAESSPLTVSIRSELVTGIASFVLKYLSAAILILLAFGGITWVGMHLWFKIPQTVTRMRREAREAERATERTFKVLREGVAHHVARLKRADRILTKEEMAFLEEFEDKLGEAEDMITKEIKDISES